MPRPHAWSRLRLTRRGWGVTASGAACVCWAYPLGWPLLLAIGVFLLLLLPIGAVAVRAARMRLDATVRSNSDAAPVGTVVALEVVMRGSTPAVAWRLVAAGVEQVHGGSGRLPGMTDQEVRLAVLVRGTRRGVFRIGPVEVDRVDPFGVLALRTVVGEPIGITVLPAVVPVALPPSLGAIGSGTRRPAAAESALDVVPRQYRDGDSVRRVDWRATAHRGELMVRDETGESGAVAVVVLDARRRVWDGDERGFEDAVVYAASLVTASAPGGGVHLVCAERDSPPGDLDSALRLLGEVALGRGQSLAESVRRARSIGVRSVHLVTGSGAASELLGLPRGPAGSPDTVSLVGAREVPAVPQGWTADAPDVAELQRVAAEP